MASPSVSLVIPVYNEKENIPLLIQRLKDVTNKLSHESFEFIFVDDGSSDQSFRLLKDFSAQDNRAKALKLSRNFGSHSACLAGLAHAHGERMIILAADLQDPPELIGELLGAQKKDIDVVWAKRREREDSKRVLFFASLYHRLMRRLIFKEWPGEGADVVLLTRRVRDALLAWPEKNTSLFGQIFWLGFPYASISYVKGKRHAGKSKWNIPKQIKLGLDSIISFSFLPIRLISYLGVLISLAGFLYSLLIIFLRVTNVTQVPGWSTLMIVILLVSGLQLLMLGIIGEYLWRSADQVKTRPSYVVTEQFGFQEIKPVPVSPETRVKLHSL